MVIGLFRDVRSQEPSRRGHEARDLFVGQHFDLRERTDRAREQNLGLVDIADPGEDALVQQDVGDLAAGALTDTADRLDAVEVIGKKVRTEPPQLVVAPQVLDLQHLRDRDVEAHGNKVFGRHNDPHRSAGPLPALAGAIDVPAAIHPHVRSQQQTATEFHQDVFPRRTHPAHQSSRDPVIVMDARQVRKHGLEPDHRFARQRAIERPRRAKDGVSFRHRIVIRI